MVNRRTVLIAGGGLVIAGTGLAGIAFAAPSSSTSANGFRRMVGQTFGVMGTTAGSVDVTLDSVLDVPSTISRQEQFTLLFTGPAAQPIDVKAYTVEHYASGRRYQMYLDSAGTANGAPRYRADFSLIGR